MNKVFFMIFGLAISVSLLSDGFADRRGYVWTYEYMTMPKGLAEVEFYTTVEVSKLTTLSSNVWKHWFELEYGITDNWDLSIYQQFKQTNSSSASASVFEYDGLKLRTRYRIAERGQLPVDILLYLEGKQNDNLSKQTAIEGKVIIAKEFYNFNVSYNQVIERQLKSDASFEHKFAAGIGYEFSPSFKVGMEGTGDYVEGKYHVGPTLSFASEKLWFNIGGLYGLNYKSTNLQVRTLAGIFF